VDADPVVPFTEGRDGERNGFADERRRRETATGNAGTMRSDRDAAVADAGILSRRLRRAKRDLCGAADGSGGDL